MWRQFGFLIFSPFLSSLFSLSFFTLTKTNPWLQQGFPTSRWEFPLGARRRERVIWVDERDVFEASTEREG